MFARRDDADGVGDELEQVGIAGDDPHAIALGGGLGGERADHIVGLEPLTWRIGISNASTNWRMRTICWRNSSGIEARVAL